jgi:hypothetical protein
MNSQQCKIDPVQTEEPEGQEGVVLLQQSLLPWALQ